MNTDKESEEEYQGPLGLFPVPYSRGVFNFHWFNFFNAICFQIILGAPTVLLAKELGASSTILGIIAAFTPLMTTLQLPAARHLGMYSYRSFTLMGWGLRSIFIATSAIVPLLYFFTKEIRLGLLLASLFFFNVLRGISSAAFLPWITNVVQGTMRGRFISIDQTFVYGGSLITMFLSSLMMRGQVEPWRYSLVLWLSVAGSVISLLFLRLIPDPPHPDREKSPSRPVPLRVMVSLEPFRNSILFSLLFTTVAGGLGVFPIEYLRMQAQFSPSAIYALSAASFIAPMITLQWVGARVDRLGSIPMIRYSVSLFAVVLALWFAMSAGLIPHDWKLVLLLNLLGGVAMAGVNMANLHLGMAVVPESGKNHFFAMTTVITSFGMGIVPVLWGWLLDALGGMDLVYGPFHLRRHSIYFLGVCLLSLCTLLASRILIDPGQSGRMKKS
ncbi:MAG: MFS transporter [bacterium]